MTSSPQIKALHFFIKFAAKELRLKDLPNIKFVGKEENKYNAFGHSKGNEIVIRITERHPNDIMRTIAHELVHIKQNINGTKNVEDYREDEANKLAGRIMRKFNITYPSIFKEKAIREDVTSSIPANSMRDSSPSNPSSAIAQPENPYWSGKPKVKRRKRKPLREILEQNPTKDPSRVKSNDNPVAKRLKDPTASPKQKGSDNTVRNSLNNGNKELNNNPNTKNAIEAMESGLKKQNISASDKMMKTNKLIHKV
jgi:hypothetical protein